jgi:hypothetical protein
MTEFEKSEKSQRKFKMQAVFTRVVLSIVKGKLKQQGLENILTAIEFLGNENKLKLGADLSNFLILCLHTQDKLITQRISNLLSPVSSLNNDLIKLCLFKDNINLVLENPESLSNVVFEISKFYLATKDYE